MRKDPFSHSWVIFAADRNQQNNYRHISGTDMLPEHCPFCPGNEGATPPEIIAIRPATSRGNTPGWSLRVIPNQFALLHIEGKFDRRGEGLYDMMNGIGAHEVIIEGPEHGIKFFNYSMEKMREILAMYRERHCDLMRDNRFRHIQTFRNYAEPFSTVSHPHSQIMALPIVPRWVRSEIDHAYEYWQLKERCIFCDIITQDSRSPRLVYENDNFTVLEPFASRQPFETWIYPKDHAQSYHIITDSALDSLADALKVTLSALAQALADPPYNMIFHSAPVQPEKRYNSERARIQDFYHWHIEIIPHSAASIGLDYGTGFHINSVMPEDAAEFMRSVIETANTTPI
ncbi:MAG: galactose-1-phosphate uridylyltransferase [Candidatus Sumerlaeota bacterium]|nr:galactose-1-phosphate uridylyltransferase [Candidatus Sumerlaeota bacterium]